MPYLQNTGVYRAKVEEIAVQPKDTGSVMVSGKLTVFEAYNADTQSWIMHPEEEVTFSTCLIKTNGDAMPYSVKMLTETLGWDGDLQLLQEADYSGLDVIANVKEEEYEGKTRFKCDRIAPTTADPTKLGGMQKATANQLSALNDRFGSQLRALIPQREGEARPVSASAPAKPAAAPTTDDIPF